MITQFINGKIIRDGHAHKEDLWIDEGVIITPQEAADVVVNLHGHYVAPGYIDLQINGGFGVDFTTNLQEVRTTAKKLLRHGVTAFLATLISSPAERYREQLADFEPQAGGKEGAAVLGLHLEGPFFNPEQNGAHSPQYIRDLSLDTLESMYGEMEHVKMVTLAPEISGALDAIKSLSRRGIVVAAGHTNATEEQLSEGIEAGLSVVTHLYNAMSPFHHRRSGVVGATLLNKNLHFSIISDGVHVNDAGLHLAWRMNSKGLFLVSDAVALWGVPKKRASQGQVDILADAKKVYVVETGRLAGALMGLDANVRHLKTVTGCSAAYAIEAASTKPARILGLEHQIGSLKVGCQADLVILDHDLDVQATYIKGECVYTRRHLSDES
ncbi:MAG: N-acetylglucosamine-6-phosphate deacetylase [Chlamydiales bacterium 38-26]|nr:N-acetylglucosamine-6-phosphate deacetylase [Chlamydiales bacterium]OJV09439.1 MAG: N-acetylglucosamine-6-phosphate deacetylase [Chlamydiales bacterium 38-26]